jgi:hypothetical protein
MIRSLIIGLWLLAFSGAHSQWIPTMFQYNLDTTHAGVNGLFMLRAFGFGGASAMDNGMVSTLYSGGFIDDATKQRNLDRHSERNRAGLVGSGEVTVYDYQMVWANKPHIGLKATVGTEYFAELAYSKNLFQTVFFGNGSFVGQGADIGPFDLSMQSFQKFGLGFFNRKNLSSVTVSYVNGSAYQELDVYNAYWKTSPERDSLTLGYGGVYYRHNADRTGWGVLQGRGVSLDGELQLPLQDNKGCVSLSVRNIGYVRWSQGFEQVNFDSSTVWRGIEINNVFDFSGQEVAFPNIEDTLNLNRQQKRLWRPLPGSIHLRYARKLHTHWGVDVGVSVWPGSVALPLAHAGLSGMWGAHSLRMQLSAGGFIIWNVGLEYQLVTSSGWVLAVGSYHVPGWWMKRTSGLDARVTIGKTIFKEKEEEKPTNAE